MSASKRNAKRRLNLNDEVVDSTKKLRRKSVHKGETISTNTKTQKGDRNKTKVADKAGKSQNVDKLMHTNNATIGMRNAIIQDTQIENQQVGTKSKKSSKVVKTTKLTKNKIKGPNGKQITPIIQTRGMKAKKVANNQVNQDEINYFNNLDLLTHDEFIAGKVSEETEHDGVLLSIHGSDLEDFPDEENQNQDEVNSESRHEADDQEPNQEVATSSELLVPETEPGELSSSDEESEMVIQQPVRRRIAS